MIGDPAMTRRTTLKETSVIQSGRGKLTTIPKVVTELMNLKKGDKVIWEYVMDEDKNERIELRKKGKTKEEQRELRYQKSIRNRTNRQRKIIQ